MIDNLKPYPSYKDSGVPWLGKVPVNWDVKRAKNILRPVDIRSVTGEEELLTVSSNRGVVPRRSAVVTMFKAESYIGHKLCWPGDLVINSLWAWSRGLGVSKHHGIVSTAYGVYRPRTGAVINPLFIHELVRSVPFQWELQVRSKGVWTSRLQLTDDSFLGAPLPIPSSPEQSAIVRFLDHIDRRIRRYIRAKQKLIKLLEEQKQAIIHRAITRGLDPNVCLKPSGVEWLGDVPEHWTLKRFKFLARVMSGQVDPREPQHRGKILIAPNHIKSGAGIIIFQETAEEQGADSGKYEVRRGEIIYSKIRPNLRKAAIATGGCLCSADMYPIAVRETELRSEYFLMLLLSAPFTKFAVDCSLRVAMPKVNREALGKCWIWYPDLTEQDGILQYVNIANAPSDLAIARTENQIRLFREYRTRLISDVVTGKIDVREAATSLPDEVEESDQLEDLEETANVDEEGEGTDIESATEEA